jgi:hypothetical protein
LLGNWRQGFERESRAGVVSTPGRRDSGAGPLAMILRRLRERVAAERDGGGDASEREEAPGEVREARWREQESGQQPPETTLATPMAAITAFA